jgi:GT2 family glycosyltransferase
VAVIIVTYNSRDEIGSCLESLVGHTAPFAASFTVVDNGSTDDTVAIVRRQWPMVQLIEVGANVGFARANNVGIRATQSEFVVIVNPDTVAPPGGLQALVRGLAAHPEAAIAGPRRVEAGGVPAK